MADWLAAVVTSTPSVNAYKDALYTGACQLDALKARVRSAKAAASDSAFGTLFREFFQTFRALAEEHLRPIGFTFTQSMVLCYLDREPGITSAELARRAMVTPQSMGEVLTGMEKSGLLCREPHPDNARMQASYLTAKGKSANASCRVEMDKVDNRMLERMTPSERTAFSKLLVRAMESMRADS